MEILGNNRGMALLLTLTVISLLVVFGLEMNRRVRSTVVSSAAARDRTTLYHMAASGIHVAMAVLVEDKMNSAADTVQEDWANTEKLDAIMNAVPFEGGSVRIAITDETAKLQVNSVVRFPDLNAGNAPQLLLWERFLVYYTADEEKFAEIEPRTIVNSLKDWIDAGDDDAVTGLTGAESDYYRDLDDPYSCRNGPMPHLSDMVRVRGVSPELFYGTGETAGISEFLTVHGMQDMGERGFAFSGRININTARLPVLKALMPVGSEEFAQAIVDYRSEKSGAEYVHDISSSTWYTNVPGMSALEGDNLSAFQKRITTSSDIFTIEATAERNNARIVLRTVVQREKEKESGKWRCRVLSREPL